MYLKGLKEFLWYRDSLFFYLSWGVQEYEAPRRVLNSIPGVELLELHLVKEIGFCCGGGG